MTAALAYLILGLALVWLAALILAWLGIFLMVGDDVEGHCRRDSGATTKQGD
jgi:hypothetical protein